MLVLKLKYKEDWIIAMGDFIDCVPLINYLTEQYGRLLIPCYGCYKSNFESFFPPDANIEFLPLYGFDMVEDAKKKYGALEITGCNPDDTKEYYADFEIKWVYKAAGLDYENRFKYDTIADQVKRIPQVEPPSEPYAFIPEGGSAAFKGEPPYLIDRRYVGKDLWQIVPPQTAMMLSFAKIIENAAEIHGHPTAFPRLIEKLPTKGKLFMHNYVRRTGIPDDKWVEYGVITKQWKQIL